MFLGCDILNDSTSFNYKGFNSKLSSFSVKNAIFDKVYLSSNCNDYKKTDIEWNSDVLVLATFDSKNLEGGNIGDLGPKLQSMQLKRREVGSSKWTSLAGYLITDLDNLNFVFADYFARGRDTKYEYSVTYVLKDGTELPYISASAVSDFYGAVISDGVVSYHIFLDPKITSVTRNRESNVVTTLNSRYPYVFFGSEANYDSGTFSGTIIKRIGCDNWDIANSYQYREDYVNWLTNGQAKILKIEDGREWLMTVSDEVTIDNEDHPDKVNIGFKFIQTGDYNSTDDLADSGLTSFDEQQYGVYYSVTYNLTNTSSTNNIVAVKSNSSFSTTISAFFGYAIADVSVVMNNTVVTNNVYNDATGEISIPNVSGDIIISASAVRIKASKIALNYTHLYLKKGTRKELKLYYLPENIKLSKVSWTSSNANIVNVVDGKVQAISEGPAFITATVDNISVRCPIDVISVDSGIRLDYLSEGTVVGLNEEGKTIEFYIAKHDYEERLNNTGNTLLVRKDVYSETVEFDKGKSVEYSSSTIDRWCSDYKTKLDSSVSNKITPVKFYYTPKNNYNSTDQNYKPDQIATLTRDVFILSVTELGVKNFTGSCNIEGSLLPIASKIEDAPDVGVLGEGYGEQLTRSRIVNQGVLGLGESYKDRYIAISKINKSTKDTYVEFILPTGKLYFRPAFALPCSFRINPENFIGVKNITATSIGYALAIGESKKITYTSSPVDVTYPILNFQTSNPFVATVDKDGMVTGVGAGECFITITLDDASTTCSVKVV